MKKMMAVVLLSLISVSAEAGVQGREMVYHIGDTEFTGYLAFDDAASGKRPGVLVLHEWWGHNAYARKRADMLAKLGYTAFALDMYGTGKLAAHPDDATKFMQAVTGDMPELKRRFQGALNILKSHSTVDQKRVAAIGYCMGGGISLNMARAGADLDGVIVFHGSLATEAPVKPDQIKADIMVFTGAADPFVPVEQVRAFEQEMNSAGVRYQLVTYPAVKHGFTNPAADAFAERFKMPLAYDKAADEDSWMQMKQFLQRIFKLAAGKDKAG